MKKNVIISADKIGELLSDDSKCPLSENRDKANIIREVTEKLQRIAVLNSFLNDFSDDYILPYSELKSKETERERLFDEVWNLYYDYHTMFCMKPEEWVEKYYLEIDSIFSREYLVKHVKKLRERYLSEKTKNKTRWLTSFLRNNIFHPSSPWLNDVKRFPTSAVIDLFDDRNITADMVTDAKKKTAKKRK